MNPWSFYEHKPGLLEGLMLGGYAAVLLAASKLRATLKGARLLGAVAALLFGLVAVFDYLLYAFSVNLRAAAEMSNLIQWLRVPFFGLAVVLLLSSVLPREDGRR